ncbi:hypothetical protein LIER_20405 [Lithospermum erythrorhizon]|uniref:Uncharacterized protein n=1 Tax=Lithospermum erythrorhizon TaxID=34254 RepID=A0AAV3QLE7_LITER
MCTDFTSIYKASPKDYYPLPTLISWWTPASATKWWTFLCLPGISPNIHVRGGRGKLLERDGLWLEECGNHVSKVGQ